MARTFNGTTDKISTSTGTVSSASSLSFAFLIRLTSIVNSSQLFRGTTAGGVGTLSASVVASSGRVQIFYSTAVTSTIAVPTDEWVIVTGSKPSGTSPVQFGLFRYGTDAWSRETLGSVADDGSTNVSIDLGWHSGNSLSFAGDMGVAGLWNRAVSTAEFDRLPYSIAAWLSTAPNALWTFDQQSTATRLLDWTGGGANQTAITGTAVSANSVPILSYGHPVIAATRTGSGNPATTGTAALALPSLTSTSTATSAASGTAAIPVPAFTAAATAASSTAATSALTAPALQATGTAAATSGSAGTATLTIPALGVSGTAQSGISGTAAVTTPSLTVSATGTATAQAGAAATLPALQATGQASVGGAVLANAALTVPALTGSGNGQASAVGASTAGMPALQASGAGQSSASAAAALILPSLQATGSATEAGMVTAAGTLQLAALVATAAGQTSGVGSAALAFPALGATGQGATNAATGTAAINLPALVVAANAAPANHAQAALTLPAFQVSGGDAPIYQRRPGILTAGTIRSKLSAGTLRGPTPTGGG